MFYHKGLGIPFALTWEVVSFNQKTECTRKSMLRYLTVAIDTLSTFPNKQQSIRQIKTKHFSSPKTGQTTKRKVYFLGSHSTILWRLIVVLSAAF